MEKEIYEQHKVLLETMMGRVSEGDIILNEIESNFFNDIQSISICACGTSYHAGLSAKYLFERLAKIKTNVLIASEFRYSQPVMNKNELFIAISQSGETADTLEALKLAKKNGLKSLAICNVDNSSIVREADVSLLTRAGIEKGVASTKAFATQMKLLWMVGEIGEVIDIIKKHGGEKICTDAGLRKELTEELADVLMYYNDVLLCYGISADELKKSYQKKFENNMKRW